MSNLDDLRAVIQDIEACGSSHSEAIQIVADALNRKVLTVYQWLSKSQKRPIPNELLELLKRKIGE